MKSNLERDKVGEMKRISSWRCRNEKFINDLITIIIRNLLHH
jgi:hypothetical protein